MRRNIIFSIGLGLAFGVIGFSCSRSSDSGGAAASKKLYIATGLCYSGTGFTAPAVTDVGQIISSLDISSRQYDVIHDYANLSDEDADTYPNGITDGGDGYIYVAVENPSSTGNRRIDKILKTSFGSKAVWQTNTVDLSGSVVRGISRAADLGILVGTTTNVERYDATPTNKKVDVNVSWGENNLGPCATNNTQITDLIALPKAVSTDEVGKFIYSHAAAGQMDIGVISMQGSNTVPHCLANAPGGAAAVLTAATSAITGLTTLGANATPTSIVFVPTGAGTGKLLVAYASSTNTAATINNALVMYDFTENTVAGETASLSNGKILYDNISYFFGVSAMAYDSSSGYLYVASSNSLNLAPVGYNIERFAVDLNAPTATRIADDDSSSFEESNSFNNCVTSMFVAD